MENVDGFGVPGGQPDIAEAEFHVFAERDHSPNIKSVILNGVDFCFSESFVSDEWLQLELPDAQFGFQSKPQAESQMVFLTLFLELPDFRPEIGIEIQLFSHPGFPPHFQCKPVLVVDSILIFHMVSSIERGKIEIFVELEYESTLDVFEVRIEISDVQETGVMRNFQVQSR